MSEHVPARDDVMAWAKEEAKLETLKYKQERENKSIRITLHADRSWIMANRLSSVNVSSAVTLTELPEGISFAKMLFLRLKQVTLYPCRCQVN